MENSYLKYLINEEIYVIDEPDLDQPPTKTSYQDDNEPSIVSEPEQIEEQEPEMINIQGRADADVLVLFNNSESSNLPETQQTFLSNILKAVGLQIADIGLINTAEQASTFNNIQQASKASILLIFALPANLDFPEISNYTITEVENRKIIKADSLSDIEKDKEKKKALWTNLQQLFLK